MFIYKLTNTITGDFYIGKTIKTPEQRFIKHKSSSKHNSQTYLHRAMRKYGFENFQISVLTESNNLIELNNLEISYISNLSPTYNMTSGGDGGDTSNSPNFIAAMKLVHEKKTPSDYATYGMLGKHVSDESKQKNSESTKKLWCDPDSNYHKRPNNSGINNPMFGKTPSNAVETEFNGVIYPSLSAAVEASGLSVYWFKKNICSLIITP